MFSYVHWHMETQVFKRLKKFWSQKQCIRKWQILNIPSLPTFWKSPFRIQKLNNLKILLYYMLYFLSKIYFKLMSFLYNWSIFLKLFVHWSQQQFLYSALLTRKKWLQHQSARLLSEKYTYTWQCCQPRVDRMKNPLRWPWEKMWPHCCIPLLSSENWTARNI